MKKIDEIKQKYTMVIESTNFAFGEIQEIIAEIHALPIANKSELIDLYEDIGQELFKKGINASNYNLKQFSEEVSNWKKKIKVLKVKDTSEEDADKEFAEKLKQFAECIKGKIKNIKRFVILRFGVDGQGSTKIVLLHDLYSRNPFLRKINIDLQPNCEIYELREFLEKLQGEVNYRKSSFLALVALSPGAQSGDFGVKFIEELKGYFEPHIEQINICDYDTLVPIFLIEKNIDMITEEINYLTATDMTNKCLNSAEEKIIKKLFRNERCHNIIYKELTAGFSGSKVFEVQPFKNSIETTKYVVKFNDINKPKLKDEVNNFDRYVKGYDNRYGIEKEETERYRAIKYNYASDDGFIESESFSSRIEKGIKDEHVGIAIEKLFNIKLFHKWDATRENKPSSTIGDYYNSYIKLDSIIPKIAIIENKKNEEVESSPLLLNLNKILKTKIPTCSKVCHGDLHTENFFIDNKEEVFLIDFGDTGVHHALIDYATLESSIKFRHIPRYIDIKELMNIEKEFLNDTTFEPSREDLKIYFKLVSIIREMAKKYIFKSEVEYYISLLMITFRQIKYDGLNQRYALNSAELLTKKIVEILAI